MTERAPRSFASRLALREAAVAAVLILLLGAASELFLARTYAANANDVIALAAATLDRRLAETRAAHRSLRDTAKEIAGDIARPRVRVAIFDNNHRLLAQSAPPHAAVGWVGALAALMNLRQTQIVVEDGYVTITADLTTLERIMRDFWVVMGPLALVAIVLAWAASFAVARRAVAPLRAISEAMRRLSRGEFRTDPLRATSDDEIGELAACYNAALGHIERALAQRDRSEAEIRQFIADAGHELRTPLTVIIGYLDIVEDATFETPALRERVFANMRQESRRMRALIEKLILLARLERGEAGTREVVDVSAIAADIVRALPPEGAAKIRLAAAGGADVIADPADVTETVRNLVDNALKYAPGADVTVSTAVAGDDVVLIVRDRGPGMSELDQAHAFDRFYRGRADGEVEGSGLGLAIVRGAVRRSGGTIALKSREGEGTELTVRFPLARVARGA
ncbi:MAG TPA: HAMP domain-containing sensor histidine kinase [Candidatus Elarobacter sp.]